MKRLLPYVLLLFLNTGVLGQQFTPAEYGPALWLDAADESSIVQNAGYVSEWHDKSGQDNHATQSTLTSQPEFISTSEGISFDGIDDVLIGNNLLYGPDTTLTVFVVAAPDVGSDKGSVIAKGQWTSGNDYRIELGENGYDICLQNAREWNSSGADWNIAHKNLVYTSYDTLHTVHYYLNGARQETPHQDVPYNPNSNPFSIGARYSYNDFFQGKIYEVLLFRKALTPCQVTRIEAYLYHKWQLQSYIIDNHPYKDYNFGLCDEFDLWIQENSPDGTSIGSVEGYFVDTAVVFSDWRIEDEGFFPGTFNLSSSGELSVFKNQFLDFELASALHIRVSALVNDIRVQGGITIHLIDEADGDPQKVHSALWGAEGERWDPRGRLPDFSYVGYKSREQSYHYVLDTADVTDFGAVTTDSLSDVNAILDAIASIDSGIVYFPSGLYIIDDYITITKDKIVLMGEGNDSISGTRFYLPKNSDELSGSYAYLITFTGNLAGPAYSITESSKMGDRSVTLASTSGLAVGDYVDLGFAGSHPADGALWDHILNDQNADWPCSVAWSNGNGGLNMYHTIERITGNIVTLKEPIRLDLNLSWNPELRRRTDWFIKDCGIENIFISHKYIPQPTHLQEPGYNSIAFSRAFNCWVNNVSIKDADNGIRFDLGGFCEIKNTSFYGRGGHHGWTFAYSSHCLADSIYFGNYDPWIHSFTLTHKSNGNVLSNITGVAGIPISTDFHRNTPWETLITNVQNDWNYNSSGVWCAGPNAGKRTVYWNMGGSGFTYYPLWDEYQSTLVGQMHILERFHPEKGWHENVPNLVPENLYLSQFSRRMNLPADPNFYEGEMTGTRSNYWERDPSRWQVKDGEYQLYFPEVPELSGQRPGEYALFDSLHTGDMVITVDARSLEDLLVNPTADASLILCYQDDENYYFLLLSAEPGQGGIFLVENGLSSLLQTVDLDFSTTLQSFSFRKSGDELVVFKNGQLKASCIDNTHTGGKAGFGTYDDAVAFDNVRLDLCPSYLLIKNEIIDMDQEFRAGLSIELDNVSFEAMQVDLIAPKIIINNQNFIKEGQLLHTISQNGCL